MRCIIYDDKNMNLNDFAVINSNYESYPACIQTASITDSFYTYRRTCAEEHKITCDIDLYSKRIELDPTTMKKIAMYNKSIELRDMLQNIKDTKDTLKELKQEMVKLQSMNDYVRDLMCDYINSSYTKFEDFMEGKFSDWKFYDEDYDD